MVEMADSSRTLGSQEERDLKKFVKFLSLKAVQVIVQSRLGEKIHTKSKPNAMGQDWFNLAISDLPEVTSEVKKVTAGRLPCKDSPLCVEISLTTSEGESMVLETWCLGMNDRVDANAKVTYTVYNRIGVLLKSLLSVTRATPAYQLSRKQGADFIMCYRVYFGEVRFQELGAGFQTLRVGSIGTPVGSITLSAAYRTKLTLPERQQVMVKSDHFASDFLRPNKLDQLDGVLPCVPGIQETFELSAEARDHIAEQIASATETEVTRSSTLSSNTPPSSSQRLNLATTPPPSVRRISQEHSTSTEYNSRRPSNLTQPVNFTHVRTKGAFAGSPGRAHGMAALPSLPSTPPFASLLRDRQESEAKNSLAAADSSLRKNSSLLHRKDSVSDKTDSKPSTFGPAATVLNQLGWDDDFVMVELKPAFASRSGTTAGDLGSFYRECQAAPPLNIFQDTELLTVGNIMEHLDGELYCFRQNAFKFDELLADLQQT